MAPGQTVIVLAGDYPERIQITRSGASGSPITFSGQGTVTMRGFALMADYITIIGFDISDTTDHWRDGIGIFVEGGHCSIEGNYVHFATRGGITLTADTSDCVVRDNRLYRNALAGIELSGRDHLIDGNEIWGTIQHHPDWSSVPDGADADGMRFFGSGHVIRGNYIHDINLEDPENVDPHIDCFQTWGHSGQEPATDIVIEQNRCENLNEGMYAFMLADASNLIIRNNLIQAYGGVNTGGGGNSHLTIVNNVFANDLSIGPYPGGVGLEDCPNSIVMNNIFYDQPPYYLSVEGTSQQGLQAGHNLIYRSDGLESQGTQYPGDVWGLDPLLANPGEGNFHLKSGSPAIDTGASLSQVTNDYDGNSRPRGSGYDIGAFEKAP